MKTGDIVTAGARNFTLGDVLGRGSWGVTYAARDALGREFAVKVPIEAGDVPTDEPLPAGALEACAAAATETAALYAQGHAWLPRLEALAATPTGAPAIVMPRYASSLRRRIAASVPLSEAVDLLRRVLGLLESAGRRHGDLRPSNVLINDRGEPVLSDPAPAAIAAHRARLGEIAGSDRDEYGPPEGPGATADTFAVCAMLYRVAMASPPGGTPRREERVPIPQTGLDKVALAGLRDHTLNRLKEDRANPRFAPRMADRLSSLLNRGLSRETDPSPPYRFIDLAALRPRLDEVAELIDPAVDDVGHLLPAVSAKNGVFQAGEPLTFSVAIACSGGVQGQEDIACGVQIVDLDAGADARVHVPETKYGVKPHPSGRLRFDFSLPDIAPGRYKITVAFQIRDAKGDPRTASGEFQVRPLPGYVPPGEDVPSSPAPLAMPSRATPAPLPPPTGDAASGPGAPIVSLFPREEAGSDPDWPRPIAPSISEELPRQTEPEPDGDTRPAPIPVEVEQDPTGNTPPPLLFVQPRLPDAVVAVHTSPTISPPEPAAEPEPEPPGPAAWTRPPDVDDHAPPVDPYLPGNGGADLPSFGGEPPAAGSSTVSLWVERAIEAARRDTYTAFMVLLVVALAVILFFFAIITLF